MFSSDGESGGLISRVICESAPVRVRSSAFRRTAIFGNSFHFLNKLRERHTWLFESATRNRVHVETESIFITPAVLCATGGRRLRRILWI